MKVEERGRETEGRRGENTIGEERREYDWSGEEKSSKERRKEDRRR